jgi:hypothetical protein
MCGISGFLWLGSLESRSPLLDHVFMEWAMMIPERVKMAGGVTKALFKKAMEPYLPYELLMRTARTVVTFCCTATFWPTTQSSYATTTFALKMTIPKKLSFGPGLTMRLPQRSSVEIRIFQWGT